MTEIDENALGKKVYEDLCAALEKRSWPHERHDEDLVITCGVAGEDIPMQFLLMVDSRRQLLRVLSRLPFAVPEDKRVDLAIATCVATYSLADGCFDYDIESGKIEFRLTASFRDSTIGDSLFEYLILCSVQTVDEYNDKFYAISKGFISIEDFISKEQ